jgi:histidine ammonia-lyase
MPNIIIDGNSLSITDISTVAKDRAKVALSNEAVNKVNKCRKYVEKAIAEGKVIYGLTTGFGKFSNVVISAKDIDELQENLILSHSINVGEPLDIIQTRAIMLLRANVLAKGYSGIRLLTLQTLIDMLNCGVHPLIPCRGSVGASGDLSPLSHLALVLIGKGSAEYKGKVMTGKSAMQKAGIEPVKLTAKEGLALNNGTQVMTGLGVLSLLEADNLIKAADVIAGMTIDALKGTPSAFDPLIHNLRPHKGQINSASNIYNVLKKKPPAQVTY